VCDVVWLTKTSNFDGEVFIVAFVVECRSNSSLVTKTILLSQISTEENEQRVIP